MLMKTTISSSSKVGNVFRSIKEESHMSQEKKNPYDVLGEFLASPEDSGIERIGDIIVSKSEVTINRVADVFDAFGYTAVTGYFDPSEDEKAGIKDKLTGYYYVDI